MIRRTFYPALRNSLLLCFVLFGSAQTHAIVDADHLYLEVDYGFAWYEFDANKEKSKKGLRYTLGWHFSYYSSVEIAYLDLGKVSTDTLDAQAKGWTVASKNRYGLSDDFAIFGRVGYGKLESDQTLNGVSATKTNNDFFYGFGIELAPVNTISFQVSYDVYKLDDYENGYLALGLLYRLSDR